MMTQIDVQELIDKLQGEGDWLVVNVRFDDIEYNVGNVIPNSKSLPESDEEGGLERDFPEYGMPEYEALPELDGTSTYTLESQRADDWSKRGYSNFDHAVLVGANEFAEADEGNLDYSEEVLRKPVVLAKLY